METAIKIARPGCAVGRVGVPQHEDMPRLRALPSTIMSLQVAGLLQFAPTSRSSYLGRVLDRMVDLDGVPDGYRAMNEREAIKVMVKL